MSWPTRSQAQEIVRALLVAAKANGCQSTPCSRHPRDLSQAELRTLDLWGGHGEVVFVYEQKSGLIYRVPLAPGQAEDIHIDVRDELATMDPSGLKAVILFDPPRVGPNKEQVHFGIVVWGEDRGTDEEPIMVYPPLPER